MKTKKTENKSTTQKGVVHLNGLPCVTDFSKPVVDYSYTYRSEHVTCKKCIEYIKNN